ncbi:hypothetical protein [Aeromicrobium sp. 179-A 4D2 NHS]|uniref:hypothetical protein n=1 Tax=Aeromicrobium sp. 179-A 4D2 NHS TaxID=3142375 RepID=UPI0039A2B119
MKFGKKKNAVESDASTGVALEVPAAEESSLAKKELSLSSLSGLFGKKKVDSSELTWTSPVRPSAFLMANYIRRRRAMAEALKKTTLLGIISAVALVLAGAGSVGLNYMAKADRDEAEATLSQSQSKLKELSKASSFFDGLEKREQSVNNELAAEVDYAKVLASVTDALPSGSKVASMTTKYGEVCSTPDPFLSASAIGCIEYRVTVKDLAAASWFLENANDVGNKYVNSFLVTSTAKGDGDTYALTGTANYTAEAFTYRFVDKGDAAAEDTPASDATDPAQVEPTTTPTTGGN